MRLISFTRGLVDNIGVKLVALIVAMMIWFNASGQQEVKRNYIATLRFVNLPDSLTMTGKVPEQVELSIAGTRRELIFLGFRKISVLVNMAKAKAGRFSQRLSRSDILLPPGVEPDDVRIISPSAIEVGVERLASKRVKAAVILSGGLAEDQVLNRVPVAKPAWITVTGPESAVQPLEKLPTKPIDLGKIKQSMETEAEIDYDRQLLTCVPDRVSVAVSISARGRRVLANVPPTILVDDDRNLTEIFPKTVSLTIEGPQALLDTLSSGDVSVLVDLGGKPPGRYTLAPEVIVPEGVEKYVMDVDSLRILVTRSSGPQSM
ncbi:MAG: CdaR family protein [Candidatus Krumholzibacteria bacterium]|nr:CdaR family protein [Candidatus Krumholzibacteria bacterium]